jgi:hypothetical protein
VQALSEQREALEGATHSALLEDERFAAITSRAIIDVVRATREGRFR